MDNHSIMQYFIQQLKTQEYCSLNDWEKIINQQQSKTSFYFRYLYSYDFQMRGRLTFRKMRKFLKLPWNMEIQLYEKNQVA